MEKAGKEDRDHGISLGEVWRKLCDIDVRHGVQLNAIEAQARMTNSRTAKLEARSGRIDERVVAVERDVGALRRVPTTGQDMSGDIRIPVNGKTVSAILLALAALVVAYLTALAGG